MNTIYILSFFFYLIWINKYIKHLKMLVNSFY